MKWWQMPWLDFGLKNLPTKPWHVSFDSVKGTADCLRSNIVFHSNMKRQIFGKSKTCSLQFCSSLVSMGGECSLLMGAAVERPGR